MALSTQPVTLGNASKNLIVALDGSGNVAVAHASVNSSGVEVGTVASPIVVAFPGAQAVSVAALPLPNGAAVASAQPALNADGGALAHVMNFPASQPVSAAALPLPAGAATSAKQAALGTAGTPSADVLTVQGAASGTPMAVAFSRASISTGQVSNIGTAATLIVAARAGRASVVIIQETTTLIRIGPSSVTLTSGVPLPGTQYSQFEVPGGAAVYGIVASGTGSVSYIETF